MIESLLIVSVGVVLAVLSLLASITAANTLFAETFGLMRFDPEMFGIVTRNPRAL